MLRSRKEPRILITRLSAIGDCIHALPLVSALRSKIPDAFIGWVTQPGPASLIQGLPGLDELIVLPRGWMKSWKSIQTTRTSLQQYRFDISIDPQSLTKSSLLGWLSGAKQRIGFTKGQARELSPYLNTQLVAPQTTHVVDRYLELLKAFGIEKPPVEFRIPVDATAVDSTRRFVHANGIARFALMNPGAGWNSKLWPFDRYAEVAAYLNQKHQLRSVVLWAGDREKSWAEDVVAQSRSASILAPETSLSQLAELCRCATMFVGSDTGPMHLAAAVGTKCVAMYGPTKISVCGPYGKGHEALQSWYQDGSSSVRRGDDNSAMRAISTEIVMEACDRIIRRRALEHGHRVKSAG